MKGKNVQAKRSRMKGWIGDFVVCIQSLIMQLCHHTFVKILMCISIYQDHAHGFIRLVKHFHETRSSENFENTYFCMASTRLKHELLKTST